MLGFFLGGRDNAGLSCEVVLAVVRSFEMRSANNIHCQSSLIRYALLCPLCRDRATQRGVQVVSPRTDVRRKKVLWRQAWHGGPYSFRIRPSMIAFLGFRSRIAPLGGQAGQASAGNLES